MLKDLGNKFTGDEMDTIARTVSHQYYLRSLDQPLQYPSKYPGQGSKKLEPAVNTSTAVVTQATACPYAIPKLRLKTLPTPKGNTAGDYYDALDSRDADIRKGEGMPLVCWSMKPQNKVSAFVERLSSSRRVLYQRLHCIII